VSYNGSGTFNITTAGQPVVTGTVISSTAFNALTTDLATGLSTAITKDGQTTTTARVPFAAGISSALVTDATSSTTGSIISSGGISCQKALYVGTGAYIPNLGGANKIINGDMRIDQRNAGASVNSNGLTYGIDRYMYYDNIGGKFSIQQNAAAVTPPLGFTYYLGVTSLSAFAVGAGDSNIIRQTIEGLNCTDLNWGTASAKAITISFWVRSSLTGTFGGSLINNAGNRCYPFTYTISVASTWELKTVSVAGDTTGTWLTTNGAGIKLNFGLGVGATNSGTAGAWAAAGYFSATGAVSVVAVNGATWYVTGVKLEVGSIATPFVPDDYSVSLRKCQRYYCKTFPQATAPATNLNASSGCLIFASMNLFNLGMLTWLFPVTMRASPTITRYGIKSADTNWTNFTNSNVATTSGANVISEQSTCVYSAGDGTAAAVGNQVGIHAAADAEL